MSMTSKRIGAPEPVKDLDTKAKNESKSLSEQAKPTEAVVPETAASSEKIANVTEIENQTKRLSIQDKEEEKDVVTPSKKRHFEEISAQPDAGDASFNTALDKEIGSDKKVTPDSSKRLKKDNTPPKMQMDAEATVTEPEVTEEKADETKPAITEEVKPAITEEIKPNATGEVKPADEKPAEAVPVVQPEPVVETPAVVSEEPKVPEVTAFTDEVKPESKTKPAEETAVLTTPSVVKDIPASKMVSEALPSKEAEAEKPVSSTNTLEKEYQAEVNKQEDEQIQS